MKLRAGPHHTRLEATRPHTRLKDARLEVWRLLRGWSHLLSGHLHLPREHRTCASQIVKQDLTKENLEERI